MLGVCLEEGGEHEGLDGHELDENVEGGAGGILEGIAHGVSNDASLVALGTLGAQIASMLGGLGLRKQQAKHSKPSILASQMDSTRFWLVGACPVCGVFRLLLLVTAVVKEGCAENSRQKSQPQQCCSHTN